MTAKGTLSNLKAVYVIQTAFIYTYLQFVRGISRQFVCSQTPALPCQSVQSIAKTRLKRMSYNSNNT